MAADADGNGWTSMFPIDVLIETTTRLARPRSSICRNRNRARCGSSATKKRKFFEGLEQEVSRAWQAGGEVIRKPGGRLAPERHLGAGVGTAAVLKIDAGTKKVTT